MDMQWAAKASKMYDERNRELVGKKYGDILKDTPYMLSQLKDGDILQVVSKRKDSQKVKKKK